MTTSRIERAMGQLFDGTLVVVDGMNGAVVFATVDSVDYEASTMTLCIIGAKEANAVLGVSPSSPVGAPGTEETSG